LEIVPSGSTDYGNNEWKQSENIELRLGQVAIGEFAARSFRTPSEIVEISANQIENPLDASESGSSGPQHDILETLFGEISATTSVGPQGSSCYSNNLGIQASEAKLHEYIGSPVDILSGSRGMLKRLQPPAIAKQDHPARR